MSLRVDPCQRVIDGLRSRGCDPRSNGLDAWVSRCPVHQGSRHNLSVKQGDDGRVLLNCHHVDESGQQCKTEDIATAIGLTMADLFVDSNCGAAPSRKPTPAPSAPAPKPAAKPNKFYPTRERAVEVAAWAARQQYPGAKLVNAWKYPPAANGYAWEMLRFDAPLPEGSEETKPDKTFLPIHHRPGEGWALGDPQKDGLPLYLSDQLDAEGPVYIAEGEKCADALAKVGLQAVSSSHGAKSPQKSDWSPLAGRDVILWRDLDSPGLGFATKVFSLLASLKPRPASVRGMSSDLLGWTEEGADAADYVEAGLEYGVDPAAIRDEIESIAWDDDRLIDPARYDSDAAAHGVAEASPKSSPRLPLADLTDLGRKVNAVEWIWPGWIPKGVVVCVGADPGKGKTRLLLDLAARLWHGREWPDGTAQSNPPQSQTLWVCGGRQFSQLVEAAPVFGLPGQALVLAAPPDNPMNILDMDSLADLVFFATAVEQRRPALAIIDTIGNVTNRNLAKPQEARQIFGPLMDIAAKTGVAIIVVTHLSMDGNALGRRIEGSCRTVIKLTEPDPENAPRHLKVAVTKTAWKPPEALGAIAIDDGFQFGDPPKPTPTSEPSRSTRGKRGPAPVKRDACKNWLKDYLSPGPARLVAIREASEASGFKSPALYDAKRLLDLEEFETREDGGNPKKWWKLP